MQGSIEGPLDTGFVAGEFLEGAAATVILEECRGLTLGFRQLSGGSSRLLVEVDHADIEQAGLDGAQTLEAPGGHDYLLDQQIFGRSDGLMLGFKSLEHFLKFLLILVFEYGVFGGEAVAQSVEADGIASFGGIGACAFLSVQAIGIDLFLRRHRGRLMVTGGISAEAGLTGDVVEAGR